MQQSPANPPQQPGYYAATRPTNALAVVSLAFGIAGYVFLPFIGGIVAVVTGHMARGQIKRAGEGGGGFALAGLILGYVNVILTVLVVAVVLVVLAIAGASIVNAPQS